MEKRVLMDWPNLWYREVSKTYLIKSMAQMKVTLTKYIRRHEYKWSTT